jgi:hypothetical protein
MQEQRAKVNDFPCGCPALRNGVPPRKFGLVTAADI